MLIRTQCKEEKKPGNNNKNDNTVTSYRMMIVNLGALVAQACGTENKN